MLHGLLFVAKHVKAVFDLVLPDGWITVLFAQGLRFAGDAPELIAGELDLGHMAFVAVGAERPDQSTAGVVVKVVQMAFGLARVDGARYQASTPVVLVAGDLARVFAFQQLPRRVVAVTLGSVVEVDLFDQPIHLVVLERGLGGVFIDEGDQASGFVVFVADLAAIDSVLVHKNCDLTLIHP